VNARPSDEHYMARALDLARARLGRTAPNPAVGCVIVRDGSIVGQGATGQGGRPHAEEIALEQAGDRVEGATVYVSLEPCNVRSSGLISCSQRLAQSGVVRVAVACEDPNPPAAHGVSRLGAAGVEVMLGILRAEAEALNCGFFKRVKTGRPWLAADCDPSSHDAEFSLIGEETFEEALDRLGRAGLTRVFVLPSNPLATALRSRALIDE